jgi:hypothetical protein
VRSTTSGRRKLVGQDVALPLANPVERLMIPRLGFEDFLLLQR